MIGQILGKGWVVLSRRRPHIILEARLSIRHIGEVDYFFRLKGFWKILVLMDLKHTDSEVHTTTPAEPPVFPISVLTSQSTSMLTFCANWPASK